MRKTPLIANMLIVVIMSSLVYANYQYYVLPSRFLESVGAAYQTRQGNVSRVSQLYTFHIELGTGSPGNSYIYMPVYEPMGEALAARLFESFGITGTPQSIIETGDAFFAADNRAMLTINKFERTLHYTPFFEPRPPDLQPIDTDTANDIALEFVEARSLFVPHDNIETVFDGVTFELSFVNRLGGLKNYSFNTALTLDLYGRVLEFTYSDITFERLSSHEIISALEAGRYLPHDIESRVDIKSVELVNTFENSIVQPAYLFQGFFEDGSTFRVFVLAARF